MSINGVTMATVIVMFVCYIYYFGRRKRYVFKFK